MTNRFWPAAALAAAAGFGLLSAGCGRSDRPPLGRVSGTITYNEQPLAKANVIFFPDKEGIRSGMGVTDEQGRYTLFTYDPGDGAPVGKHKVTVTLRGAPQKVDMHPSVVNKALGEAYYEQAAATGKPLIPEKFFNPMTSGLAAEVKSGSNTLDFALTGPPLAKK
ncbi:MAG: carboxypeptidase-like regulatory domain-containing protein [Gemmataceae bacterium]